MLELVAIHLITNFQGYGVNILPNNKQFAHFHHFWTNFDLTIPNFVKIAEFS